ncbi:MAG: amidohydrolase [Shewanella indica]|uniref:amidohydrolase n=1 Tax=Shewanella indica TaxID=768528 RepID=UPI003C75366A
MKQGSFLQQTLRTGFFLVPLWLGFNNIVFAVDTIYLNGNIITMNDVLGTVEAVAVEDGKIKAVGKSADLQRLATSETSIVDLKERTMLPGFIDAHGHFFLTAEYAYGWVDLNSPPIGGVKSIEEMIALLKEKADATPEGQWVLGWGYDDSNILDMRHPTRADLDKVSRKHPIYVQHISGWISSANSLALEMAGINKDSSDPSDGKIRKDPITGEPTGVIESALSPVYNLVPKYTEDDYVKAIEIGSDMWLASGTTTAQEGWGDSNQWAMLKTALQRGNLKVRTVFWPLAQGSEAANLKGYPATISGTSIDDSNMLVLGASKLTADGSIQGYSGYLSHPYHQHPEDKSADYRGYPTRPQEQLTDMVTALHKEGRQLAIHGNGDAGIDMILDAFDAAQKAYPRQDARHIVVHSQMVREDQLKRMKHLGVIPSFFATHTYFWGDRHYNIFMGPERAVRMSPVRSALQMGLPFTLHNDTYVTPMSPLMSVWSAVNRQSFSGRDMGKEMQGVTVYEALKGVTINAAWQGFEENIKGSIEVGKLADFVVLDENPLEVDPLEIKNITVRATILGNNVAFGVL